MNFEEKYKDLKKEFDEFVYIVSHDFNGPLRAINNLSEWIEEDLVDVQNEDIEHNFKLLRSRVNRLTNMVNASRDISRIERYDLDIEEVSIKELIQKIISTDNELSGISTSFTGEYPVTKTLSKKIEDVISVVLNNCANHNKLDKLQIKIDGKINKKNFEITIKDNGVGISEYGLTKVFDLFYTIHPKDQAIGIGAGLYYAKKIINFVQGEIKITSKLNKGTSVNIKWPLKIEL